MDYLAEACFQAVHNKCNILLKNRLRFFRRLFPRFSVSPWTPGPLVGGTSDEQENRCCQNGGGYAIIGETNGLIWAI